MKFFFLFLFVMPFAIAQTKNPVPPVQPAASVLPSPSPAALSAPIPENVAGKTTDVLGGVIEDYTYNPEGKRDPFLPYDATEGSGLGRGIGPAFPLQKYDVDQLKLVGIIWGVSQPKAMLTDPSGRGHVVKINDRLGRNNGYVARIREGELVIVESFKGPDGQVTYQTRMMKLGGE